MHLYLIRHGESHINVSGLESDVLDSGLTDRGQRQAAAMVEWMIHEVPAIDALYASTMNRTRETAQMVAGAYGCEILWEDRLREFGNNRLDHSPIPSESLPRQYRPGSSRRFPFLPIALDVERGESLMHVRARVGMLIEEWVERHQGQTIIAVCHWGIINAALEVVMNIGSWRRCKIRHDYTSVTHLEYEGESDSCEPWMLYYMGRREHLIGVDESNILR